MEKFSKNYLRENKHKINLFIWLLYVVLLCYVSYYHGPWHDEGQAWLIARDDSLWQLLTVTTHYEGHPPLWHLCLMPWAKIGIPFSLGIKAVNIFFCAIAMWFLIACSPLPWYLRLALPFTYFFFYQFGVVDRVYSLLMLGIMLCAYYYPKRQQHPYKLALSLALAAGSQAYGMMFACGVALAWLAELWQREQINSKKIFLTFQQSGEAKALLLLFFLSFGFGLTIIPFKDTAFTSAGAKTGFVENMFYLFTVLPGQFLSSNSMQSSTMSKSIEFFYINLQEYLKLVPSQGFYMALVAVNWVVSYTYGVLFNLFLLYMSLKEKKALLFLTPLLLMNILGSLVYWNLYHTGIWGCFYVFIIWQLWYDKEALDAIEQAVKQKFTYPWEYIFVKACLLCCCLIIFGINLSWTWEACKTNVLHDTDPSAKIAAMIKENKLTDYKIWVAPDYKENRELSIDNVVTGTFAINCYFPHNILQNLDGGGTNYSYHEYKILPKEKYLQQVRKLGQPDFIIGEDAGIRDVFPNSPQYVPIKEFPVVTIWKNTLHDFFLYIYMREDLLGSFPQFHVIENRNKK